MAQVYQETCVNMGKKVLRRRKNASCPDERPTTEEFSIFLELDLIREFLNCGWVAANYFLVFVHSCTGQVRNNLWSLCLEESGSRVIMQAGSE